MNHHESVKEMPVEGSDVLYILFGGMGQRMGMPRFEFMKSSQILNENCVFIRDIDECYYHRGLKGVSNDIPSTAKYLKTLIGRYSPSQTLMVGNSMGGYAALLFASLVGDARAIAFGPRTFLGPRMRYKNRDRRCSKKFRKMYMKTLFVRKYFDLSKLGSDVNWSADVHVARNCRLDMLQAKHISGHPNVTIHEHEKGGHKLVRRLRSQGKLQGIIKDGMV